MNQDFPVKPLIDLPLVNQKGERHPFSGRHPHGEDRTWCTRCGRPAFVDDLSFHVWHCAGGWSPANTGCVLDIASSADLAAARETDHG